MAGINNPFRQDDETPWPIGANTGGPIDPVDHIGHLDEFAAILAVTIGPNNVGALVHGDRRMGKTSLLNLLERALQDEDVVTIRVSAETSDPLVFAARLREALASTTFLRKEVDKWSLDLDVSVEGIKVKRTAKGRNKPETTDDLFDYAVKHAGGRKLVVILDEITVLASGFAKNDPEDAKEFLRSLRAARQRHPEQLAMILTGSIGLHHVVADMSGVNDLTAVRVAELTPEHAAFLARCLILGEQVPTTDNAAVAARIALFAGDAAFYVQHLVKLAGSQAGPLELDDVEALLETLLRDPDDPCHFRHYRDRLADYYGRDAKAAGRILDACALADEELKVEDLQRQLDVADLDPTMNRDQLVVLLENLERDSYLVRTGAAVSFSSSVLRRAWRSIRWLS